MRIRAWKTSALAPGLPQMEHLGSVSRGTLRARLPRGRARRARSRRGSPALPPRCWPSAVPGKRALEALKEVFTAPFARDKEARCSSEVSGNPV